MDRLYDLQRFYQILAKVESKLGGKRFFIDKNWAQNIPKRGVYFFFEPGEYRSHSGSGLRVVRVGTHAVNNNSRRSLRDRLAQHRGNIKNGGGHHSGSIFRKHIGCAQMKQSQMSEDIMTTWMEEISDSESELLLEQAVSRHIRRMPFIWIEVDDPPSPWKQRQFIESNSIALLSNYQKEPLDPLSSSWLGGSSCREFIKMSGLWNVDHVNESYDPSFLDLLEDLVNRDC
jgi:hypothetical protein